MADLAKLVDELSSLTVLEAAELSKMLSPALQAFMAGGQKLIADVVPSTPLPLLEGVAGAGDPAALVDRLGVTVRSEPAQ